MSDLETKNLATAKDVNAALKAIGLPEQPMPVLQAISQANREAFLERISHCVTRKDEDGKFRQWLDAVLDSVKEETLATVHGMGYTHVTLNQMARCAIGAPVRFSSAIKAASDPAHASHAAAKAYLDSLLVSAETPAAPEAEKPQQRAPLSSVPKHPDVQNAVDRPAPAPTRSPSPEAAYASHHAYGSNAALCFNAINGRNNGKPGIMVDAAVCFGGKTYDWQNATHLWLDEREVASVLAVFRRWRKGVEFNAHGSQNDKSFFLEYQGGYFFAKLTSKKTPLSPVRAVKIMPPDAHKIALLFLQQLLAAYPDLPHSEVLNLARTVNEERSTGT